ncbi:response regulator [Sulfurimonas sp.]
MKKILIVDDSSMIRSVVSKATKKLGYEVAEASNGKEGLEQLIKHDDISLIVSDINMPIMDGMTMVAQIKENEKFKYTPIVMLTTEDKDELKTEARALGIKAWMLKPFNEKSFTKAIMKLIG